MLYNMGVLPLCQGIETGGKLQTLRGLGVCLMQRISDGRPALEALPMPLSEALQYRA
jgi:hypothetical protein